jgi:hypothetical protein
MAFNSNLNWQSILTLLAVVSAWAIPLVMNCSRRKRRREVVRDSVSLYLDALQIKANVAKTSYFQPGRRVPKGKNSFEAINKLNFDAIEKLCASEDLGSGDRRALLNLIKYYKLSPVMESEEDFDKLVRQLDSAELRRHFPKGSDLDKKINELNDEYRKKRLTQSVGETRKRSMPKKGRP